MTPAEEKRVRELTEEIAVLKNHLVLKSAVMTNRDTFDTLEKIGKLLSEKNALTGLHEDAAYLYLDMSTFYLGKHLYGFASWFKKQAVEETEHADKMISYLAQEGAPVELKDVAHAGKSYKDLKEPLAFQLEHEMYVTSLINKIYDAADEANDRRTAHFLDWFIDEQTEEEGQQQPQDTTKKERKIRERTG